MSNTIRIKRRASGNGGAPSSLENAELAYNEVDDVLYYGKGTGGIGGTATTVEAIGGAGSFLTLATAQTVTGNKTFSGTVIVPTPTSNTHATTKEYVDAAVANASTTFTASGDSGTVSITTGDTFKISGGTGLTSNASSPDTITIDLDNTTVTASSYGTSSSVASFTVDAQGRLTAATNTAISIASTAITDFTEATQDVVGAMVSTNTESGISVTYDDINGKLDFDVNDPTITIAGDVDGSATMTNLGNTTINVTLDTVNASPGTYGSSTAIPVVTVNGKGLVTNVSTASISTNLSVAADTGTADTVALGTDTLTFTGGEGIDTAVTDNTITISAEDATTTNKGVASFASGDFDVTSGAVSIKSGGVDNTQLANSSVTIGSTSVSLGATSTSITGLTEVTVDNLNFNGNEISSTDSNGNISLNPNGSGSIAVNGAKITGLGTPTEGTDAATKAYVDNAVTGLDWKAAVHLFAASNVALTGATATLVIDGHSALDVTDNNVYRILLTGQTTSSDNGIYLYTDDGTNYALVRAVDADSYQELIGISVFVMEGSNYANTGWVQSNHYLTDFSGQQWVQFSGAGTYSAGDGLSLTGSTFAVNVATSGGIEISADSLQLKSTLAGNGLTYASGILAIGGTADRISISSDAIDIASTYVGQASITTLGTITTGVWNGTTIAIANGGTGSTTASGARTNLGLGTIATQNASNVAITGGSISSITLDLVTIDGGTF